MVVDGCSLCSELIICSVASSEVVDEVEDWVMEVLEDWVMVVVVVVEGKVRCVAKEENRDIMELSLWINILSLILK